MAISAGQRNTTASGRVPGEGAPPDLSPPPPPYRGERSGTGAKTRSEWLTTKIDNSRRAARETSCRCGAPILVGPDADRAALTATVDPEPIDAVAELHTLLDGRHTYDLHGRELHARDDRWSVLREHHCEVNPT